MICDGCKTEKPDKDFINNQEFCYRCVYRIKIEKHLGKRTPKVLYCRYCGDEIIHKPNEKKRQRSVYCSYECAEKGHKKQVHNYWTRIIP